jgi:hypothetical protein
LNIEFSFCSDGNSNSRVPGGNKENCEVKVNTQNYDIDQKGIETINIFTNRIALKEEY